MVNEGSGRRAEADTRGRMLQGGEEIPELGLRLGGVLRTVRALGVRGEMAGYVS